MTENKRYDWDLNGIWDYNDESDGYIESYEDITKLLNEQEETIQTQKDYIIRMGHGTIFEEMKRLKERNQRQCERLKEITDLMQNRDWEALETMVEDWEQTEELLQAEMGTYGGGMTTKDCFHCYYAQSNEDGIHCYRETRTKVKGTDTCEYYKK